MNLCVAIYTYTCYGTSWKLPPISGNDSVVCTCRHQSRHLAGTRCKLLMSYLVKLFLPLLCRMLCYRLHIKFRKVM